MFIWNTNKPVWLHTGVGTEIAWFHLEVWHFSFMWDKGAAR
jgi:hypothetical protein